MCFIGPRPIMPTAQVCHKFEHLQNSILNMFELKKLVDKTETEHKVKLQKGGIGITAGRVNYIPAYTVALVTNLYYRNVLQVMQEQWVEAIEKKEKNKFFYI